MRLTDTLGAIVVAMMVSLMATPAAAWRADLTEELHLDVETHVALGYAFTFPDDPALENTSRPYLRMGRARGRVALDGAGYALVQVDAAGGEFRLLDAVAALMPTDYLTVRLGRFKVPLSADFMIPLPNHPLTSRPSLVRHVPRRRLGADATLRLPVARLRLDIEAGLFAQEENPALDSGKLFTSRVGLRLSDGLRFHIGYAQLVLSDNGVDASTGNRPMPEDKLVDFAVILENEHVFAHAEALLVLDGPDHERSWGAASALGYSFGDRRGAFAVSPVVAYDVFFAEDGGAVHRATGAMNFYFTDSRIILRADYEASIRERAVAHAVMLEVQISF